MAINQTQFVSRIQKLHENIEKLDTATNKGAVTRIRTRVQDDAEILIVDLLKCRAAWSSAALVDMLDGAHGERVAFRTWCGVAQGCSTFFESKSRLVRERMSFGQWCIQHGRYEVLALVAKLALPPAFSRANLTPVDSTNPEGALLDRLFEVVRLHVPGSVRALYGGGLLKTVTDNVLNYPTSVLRACARLQMDIDPAHAAVDDFTGKEMGALLTEALMNKQIQAGSASNDEHVTPMASARTRRAGL